VYVRAEQWGASGAPVFGPWASVAFTLDPDPTAPLPDVGSLKLANDTGTSNTDLSTSDPTVTGQLSAPAPMAMTIQFDTNDDGVADDSVNIGIGASTFTYTPSNLPQGQVTIQARTALAAAQDGGTSGDTTIVETGNWFSFSFEYSSTPDSTQAQAAADQERAALLSQIGQVSTQQQSGATNSLTAANDSAAQAYHQAVDGGQATNTAALNAANSTYNAAITAATTAYNTAVGAAQTQFASDATAAGDESTVGVPADFSWGDAPSLDPTVNGEPAVPQPGSDGPDGLAAPTFTGPAIDYTVDPNYSTNVNGAVNAYNSAVAAANATYAAATNSQSTAEAIYSAAISAAATQNSNADAAAYAAYQAAIHQSAPASLDLSAVNAVSSTAIALAQQTKQNADTAAFNAQNQAFANSSAAFDAAEASTIAYYQAHLTGDPRTIKHNMSRSKLHSAMKATPPMQPTNKRTSSIP